MFRALCALAVFIAAVTKGDYCWTSGPDVCPEGRKRGDVWYFDDECAHCVCQSVGFGCWRCDFETVPSNCYTYSDYTLEYYYCCKQRLVICEGDINFDRSLLKPDVSPCERSKNMTIT